MDSSPVRYNPKGTVKICREFSRFYMVSVKRKKKRLLKASVKKRKKRKAERKKLNRSLLCALEIARPGELVNWGSQ